MQAHVDGGIMLAMQMGFNARNAVVAVDMAERGLDRTGLRFWKASSVFSGCSRATYDLRSQLGNARKGFGESRRLAHKPFPSGRATHGVLDGLLTLKQ